MPVSSYSTTPANNNSAPPNGAPEGMAPSTVNDVLRQIMADVRVFYDDTALLSDSNVFTAAYSAGNPQIRISAVVPMMQWYQSTGGADAKLWQAYAGANKLVIGTAEDDEATSVDGIVLTRSVNTITDINLTATTVRVNGGTVASGTYTPTVTAVTNVTTVTSAIFQWMRIGSVVTVSGHAAVDPASSSVATLFNIAVPIASSFATATQASGSASPLSPVNGQAGSIQAIGSDTVRATVLPAVSTEQNWAVHFTYLVV